ncbi:nitroreductase family deazaflavin-dependent oxidoreductase [Kitasatospora sp. NPDC059648]|uniref:nitroreductase family deazaflavin-dependent oxidoreductase n=1 Tax=Kitasatospora sp. NPDC059648 TaxID=3346894 RepID=UPI00367C53BE
MAVRRRPAPSPTGARRLLLRTPILLYRWHLGRLLGSRFLLLTHTGRSSGLPRRVVLEVVGRDPRSGGYLVASGFGASSQWYRNVTHTPKVNVQIGRHRFAATASALTPNESGLAMAHYAEQHPGAARLLTHFCGLSIDGTQRDYFLVGRDHIPFVALRPSRDDRQTTGALPPTAVGGDRPQGSR